MRLREAPGAGSFAGFLPWLLPGPPDPVRNPSRSLKMRRRSRTGRGAGARLSEEFPHASLSQSLYARANKARAEKAKGQPRAEKPDGSVGFSGPVSRDTVPETQAAEPERERDLVAARGVSRADVIGTVLPRVSSTATKPPGRWPASSTNARSSTWATMVTWHACSRNALDSPLTPGGLDSFGRQS